MAKQYETFSSDNLAPYQNPISAERLAFVLGQMSPVSLLYFPRFLGTQTSQRQADFSLRPGFGQGSWDFWSFFKIQISRMRKSRNKSEKFPIGLTWGKFKSLISQSSRQLETSYWCHIVQNLTDLSNDDVSRKYWQIAKSYLQLYEILRFGP